MISMLCCWMVFGVSVNLPVEKCQFVKICSLLLMPIKKPPRAGAIRSLVKVYLEALTRITHDPEPLIVWQMGNTLIRLLFGPKCYRCAPSIRWSLFGASFEFDNRISVGTITDDIWLNSSSSIRKNSRNWVEHWRVAGVKWMWIECRGIETRCFFVDNFFFLLFVFFGRNANSLRLAIFTTNYLQ